MPIFSMPKVACAFDPNSTPSGPTGDWCRSRCTGIENDRSIFSDANDGSIARKMNGASGSGTNLGSRGGQYIGRFRFVPIDSDRTYRNVKAFFVLLVIISFCSSQRSRGPLTLSNGKKSWTDRWQNFSTFVASCFITMSHFQEPV